MGVRKKPRFKKEVLLNSRGVFSRKTQTRLDESQRESNAQLWASWLAPKSKLHNLTIRFAKVCEVISACFDPNEAAHRTLLFRFIEAYQHLFYEKKVNQLGSMILTPPAEETTEPYAWFRTIIQDYPEELITQCPRFAKRLSPEALHILATNNEAAASVILADKTHYRRVLKSVKPTGVKAIYAQYPLTLIQAVIKNTQKTLPAIKAQKNALTGREILAGLPVLAEHCPRKLMKKVLRLKHKKPKRGKQRILVSVREAFGAAIDAYEQTSPEDYRLVRRVLKNPAVRQALNIEQAWVEKLVQKLDWPLAQIIVSDDVMWGHLLALAEKQPTLLDNPLFRARKRFEADVEAERSSLRIFRSKRARQKKVMRSYFKKQMAGENTFALLSANPAFAGLLTRDQREHLIDESVFFLVDEEHADHDSLATQLLQEGSKLADKLVESDSNETMIYALCATATEAQLLTIFQQYASNATVTTHLNQRLEREYQGQPAALQQFLQQAFNLNLDQDETGFHPDQAENLKLFISSNNIWKTLLQLEDLKIHRMPKAVIESILLNHLNTLNAAQLEILLTHPDKPSLDGVPVDTVNLKELAQLLVSEVDFKTYQGLFLQLFPSEVGSKVPVHSDFNRATLERLLTASPFAFANALLAVQPPYDPETRQHIKKQFLREISNQNITMAWAEYNTLFDLTSAADLAMLLNVNDPELRTAIQLACGDLDLLEQLLQHEDCRDQALIQLEEQLAQLLAERHDAMQPASLKKLLRSQVANIQEQCKERYKATGSSLNVVFAVLNEVPLSEGAFFQESKGFFHKLLQQRLGQFTDHADAKTIFAKLLQSDDDNLARVIFSAEEVFNPLLRDSEFVLSPKQLMVLLANENDRLDVRDRQVCAQLSKAYQQSRDDCMNLGHLTEMHCALREKIFTTPRFINAITCETVGLELPLPEKDETLLEQDQAMVNTLIMTTDKHCSRQIVGPAQWMIAEYLKQHQGVIPDTPQKPQGEGKVGARDAGDVRSTLSFTAGELAVPPPPQGFVTPILPLSPASTRADTRTPEPHPPRTPDPQQELAVIANLDDEVRTTAAGEDADENNALIKLEQRDSALQDGSDDEVVHPDVSLEKAAVSSYEASDTPSSPLQTSPGLSVTLPPPPMLDEQRTSQASVMSPPPLGVGLPPPLSPIPTTASPTQEKAVCVDEEDLHTPPLPSSAVPPPPPPPPPPEQKEEALRSVQSSAGSTGGLLAQLQEVGSNKSAHLKSRSKEEMEAAAAGRREQAQENSFVGALSNALDGRRVAMESDDDAEISVWSVASHSDSDSDAEETSNGRALPVVDLSADPRLSEHAHHSFVMGNDHAKKRADTDAERPADEQANRVGSPSANSE